MSRLSFYVHRLGVRNVTLCIPINLIIDGFSGIKGSLSTHNYEILFNCHGKSSYHFYAQRIQLINNICKLIANVWVSNFMGCLRHYFTYFLMLSLNIYYISFSPFLSEPSSNARHSCLSKANIIKVLTANLTTPSVYIKGNHFH